MYFVTPISWKPWVVAVLPGLCYVDAILPSDNKASVAASRGCSHYMFKAGVSVRQNVLDLDARV